MIVINDFKKEYQFFQKKIATAIDRTLKSGWYILGKEVESFESNFAAYIGSKYAIGVANGLEALQISLMALDIGPGDEVITVSNSAVATALAITNSGAKPIFVDIDKYYHIDLKDVEKKITSQTKAIIPVHLFGQVIDIKGLQRLAQKYNLFLIEDACQAHGASLNKKMAGNFGNLGCFSFYPTKNLGAYGDAGAITTNSKELYEKCKMLRNYGQKNRYEHEVKGLNSRLDEIQAAILNVKLTQLDLLVKKRNKIAKLYFKKLTKVKQITLPLVRSSSIHAFHLFVLFAEKRDELQNYLKEKGIQTIIHYPIPIHKQACYKEFNKISLKKTEEASKHILSIPIHPFLTTTEINTVCREIENFYKNY